MRGKKKSKVHLRNFSCSPALPGQSGRSEPSFALRTGKPSLPRFKMFPPVEHTQLHRLDKRITEPGQHGTRHYGWVYREHRKGFGKQGVAGKGQGKAASFSSPKPGSIPVRLQACRDSLSKSASSFLTVSRPFICPPLARRDSVLDRLSISSMIPWIWPPEIPWKSMAGGRKGQVFSSALHPTISIYRPQSL